MKQVEQTLARIYAGEKETWESQPLYEVLVLKARDFGISGATVLRGPMGYGSEHILHTAKILQLSMDLPVVIEMVEETEKLEQFLQTVGPLVADKLVTTEKVQVCLF